MLTTTIEDRLTAKLKDIEAAVPAKLAKQLTGAGFTARKALQAKMASTFQGGVSNYLRNSVWVAKATPERLEATISVRDLGGKSAGPLNAIRTQTMGGSRSLKASERRLQQAGILPQGYYLAPGQGAQLDALGNISGRWMNFILSYLQAYNQAGSELNMKGKTRAKYAQKKGGKIQGFEYFAVQGKLRDGRGKHMAPGIYHRTGTHGSNVTPVLMFVRKPHYKPLLPWHATAHAAVRSYFAPRVLPANPPHG